MSAETSLERAVQTTNGERKCLKDIRSYHEIAKRDYEVRGVKDPKEVFIPLDFDEHQPLEVIAICAQKGFEPGFVAKTALQGIKADYIMPSRPQEYSIDTSEAETAAYEEKALRDFIERAETTDPQKADYIKSNICRWYDEGKHTVDQEEWRDYNPEDASIDLRFAELAEALYDQPEARADGWSPLKIRRAERETQRIRDVIQSLEEAWPELQKSPAMSPAEDLYAPLKEIAENAAIQGKLEAHPHIKGEYNHEKWWNEQAGYSFNNTESLDDFVRSWVRNEPKTEGGTNPAKWIANPHIMREYELARAQMATNPDATTGDLRDIVREWLEHEPREDHGGSEGLLYSLRLDRDFYIKRLQAIQNGTYAEEFARSEETDE